MSNNIYNANFWELLSKYKIEIPIIQRDYVQGREENKKIRRKIISKFKDASAGKSTKLDFIYGNVKNNIFYPLDGQQRLTTLFLYHLYFALRDKELTDFKTNQLFKNFTYSTRVSSKEFFKKLLNANITIESHTNVGKEIGNQNWFISYWKNDPTVSAALSMLDEIHEQCFETNIDFKTLIDEENKDITFEFLELEKFGLSDDLYIKMNSRGIALTSYENFKADLIGYIKISGWESNKAYQDRFATKLDGKWTDYFWDEGRNSETFDSFFINFFHQFLITEIATRSGLSSLIIANLSKSDYETSNQKIISRDELLSNLLANRDDISEKFLDEQAYTTLYKLLDTYSLNSRNLKTDFDIWVTDYTGMDNLLTGGRITYPNRVFHFAHSSYLLNNSQFDSFQYNKWIRVVRNIISNSTIDTIETFRSALQLIKELSKGSGDIYEFLTNQQVKSKFAERQVKEEIQKSRLLIGEVLSYADLITIEDTRLCSGRIEFVLNYIDKNTGGDYSKTKSIADIFTKYFGNWDFSNEIRALFLTSVDGKYYDYWTSWVYIVDLPKRCLIEHSNDLRNYSFNQSYRKYFESVIEKLLAKDDVRFHLESFTKSNEYSSIPEWKQKVIVDSTILDKNCKSKMIAVAEDDSTCYLMNVGKPRSIDSLKKLV